MRNILLTNDDGIHAAGLAALEEALAGLGTLWTVAPLAEMSATSHAISLRKPLRFEELGERRFAVEGTPADAVILALHKLLPRLPDLVIAGINRGGNMGENIFYSATVAAAVEAALNRLPAFAISVATRADDRYGVSAAFAARLAATILREGLPRGVVLNVNVPEPWRNGVRFTRQSEKITRNVLVENVDPRGRTYYWVHEQVDLSDVEPDTDYAAVLEGSISVTPLSTGRTDPAARKALAGWALELHNLTLADSRAQGLASAD